MANQITDNRTQVDAAEANTNYVDLSGAAAGTADNEVFIQGSNSIGEYLTSTLGGLLYNAGSAQNWSNNTFYIWINCAVAGLLDTKANGGFRIRFTGATVTDWFEVYVAGGGSEWPAAISGGWVQFVVDIETARADAITNGWTNGTTPATSAIQRVGWAGITAGTMPRMVDNTWMDEIRRLPDGSPGIIVEGRNAGTTDWDSADIASQLGLSVGTFIQTVGGAYKINTPIQFGINDTTTHGFTDTNKIWLWDNQEFLPNDFYAISALGNSGGTTRLNLGVKSGTGNDATGAQGVTIAADPTGARWNMDFDDPNIDDIGLWGCSFQHFETFEWDDPAVDVTSTLLIDGTLVNASNASIVRATAIQPNTADGVAFMTTDDLGDIAYSSFEFTDGHAIEVLSGGPASQNNIGNIFSGAYGGTPGDNLVASSGSNDAMIYNNSGADKDFNRSGGGTQPSFRNGASATSDDIAAITLTFTPLVTGSDVSVFAAGTNTPLQSTDSSGTSFAASVGASQAIDYKIYKPGYEVIEVYNVSFATSQNVLVNQQVNRNWRPDFDES